MKITNYISNLAKFYKKLEENGLTKSKILKIRQSIEHFIEHCQNKEVKYINDKIVNDYINIMKNQNNLYQTRPILISIEFYKTKTYLKSHQNNYKYTLSKENETIYSQYFNYLSSYEDKNTKSTKRKHDWSLKLFFNFLNKKSVTIDHLTEDKVYSFFSHLYEQFSRESVAIVKYTMKFFLNFLNSIGKINFKGENIIILNNVNQREKIKTSYSFDEMKTIFNSFNKTKKNSKFLYSILTLTSYLGLRIGDIITLNFNSIDWYNNTLTIIQNKTKSTITLPLIDEVKYPLLDYILNSRNNSVDKEYVFSTLNMPYTKFSNSSSIYTMIKKVIEDSGIFTTNRKLGPHSLRHSLATNLLNIGTPIYKISNILGHKSIISTEVYISKDFTKLKELSLEVPYVL